VTKKPPIIATTGTARNRPYAPARVVAAVGKAGKGNKPRRRRTTAVPVVILEGSALVLLGRRKAMDDGPKRPRQQKPVTGAIKAAYVDLDPSASWQEVLRHVCNHIEVELDGDSIYGYGSLKGLEMTLKTFKNLVGKLRPR
jgi:hypothetical protein